MVSAVIVDSVRLGIYGISFYTSSFEALPREIAGFVVAATLAAFLGAFLGARLLKRVTFRALQVTVAVCMFAVGAGLATGLV